MNIGAAIREVRKNRGISQVELSKAAGISQSALSFIEKGRTRAGGNTLQKLCKELNIAESLLYIMAVDKMDIPKNKRALYRELFPVIKELILKLT